MPVSVSVRRSGFADGSRERRVVGTSAVGRAPWAGLRGWSDWERGAARD